MSDSYLEINRANWDSRAPIHARNYGIDQLLADPEALSDVVRFDLPRLGRLDGLDVVHLQCHIGTDTLSLARLGAASVTGVDLSPVSLAEARQLATRAGTPIDYIESDVYSAPKALGRQFDLVYTGIGAICWLPSIGQWAATVAALLRPGGRLFIRDGHPVLNALIQVELGPDPVDRAQQPTISAGGTQTLALELPYYEQEQWLAWHEEHTYAGDDLVPSPVSVEWNHSLSEIVTAVLEAGLRLTSLAEHDSVPWEPFPGLMSLDTQTGEYRLTDRPQRLPASFTLTATKPA
ncbi:2-polyprenyl-3-methyl-5-hydroxy-6-metoxy-1,4-benzoquinol methylase [Propionicimonas paludicola]|uniref:2-polyprenyl-3-methyl-5-hydroxy-6-metoxy-1, 4-benzoquinol methylase n=1 Tax=Propionicimonas paludicola TaxID=185243 RepID=A0A2A9CMQ6_9ACTN|nr:class I SAM-dependent methyltransferase [Propionicimonas paludicola]PFG15694.1 2-polyprenyl-3-methyl-5-hydroxy-6-metoxy-1,4-benzoquinol methylase [Propionicimonas paludicola]